MNFLVPNAISGGIHYPPPAPASGSGVQLDDWVEFLFDDKTFWPVEPDAHVLVHGFIPDAFDIHLQAGGAVRKRNAETVRKWPPSHGPPACECPFQ